MKKNLLFDLTNSSTSGPLIIPDVFSLAIDETNSTSNFTTILNAKDTVRIGQHAFGNLVQDFSCSPSDQGAGTLSEKNVTLVSKQVYFTICEDKISQSFMSGYMKPGSNNSDFLPDLFKTYLTTNISKTLASDLESCTWQGSTATSSVYPNTLFNGLTTQFVSNADVLTVTASSVTAANVVAQLTLVYNAVPQAIKENPELTIFVSPNVASAYRLAQAAVTGGLFMTGTKELDFIGVKMVIAKLPTNQMVATLPSNFFKITDLVSDYEDITLIPQFDKTGKHQVIASGAFKFNVAYINPTQIVYYR